MTTYSFHRNLRYMGMFFSHPGILIKEFLTKTSLWYGIVPFGIVQGICYEILYLLSYLNQTTVANPFPKILPLPDRTYRLYQLFFAPLVNAVDLLLFAGIVYGLARLLRLEHVDPVQVTNFFMLTSTIGLVSAAVDLLSLWWPRYPLIYVHIFVALISLVYVVAFAHRQAKLSWGKAVGLILPAWGAFLCFRSFFIR